MKAEIEPSASRKSSFFNFTEGRSIGTFASLDQTTVRRYVRAAEVMRRNASSRLGL
jgi:hypothetical protein